MTTDTYRPRHTPRPPFYRGRRRRQSTAVARAVNLAGLATVFAALAAGGVLAVVR
jgi:hypothetical protein